MQKMGETIKVEMRPINIFFWEMIGNFIEARLENCSRKKK